MKRLFSGLLMISALMLVAMAALAVPAPVFAAVGLQDVHQFLALHLTVPGGGMVLGACVSVVGIRSSTCGANTGGTTKLYVIAYEDVESIPAVGADGVTITGDIVPKAGKTFVEWEFAQDTGEIKFKASGDIGSQAYEVTKELYIPTYTPAIGAVLNSALNRRFIIIFEDGNGQMAVGGDMRRPMTLEQDYGSGKKFNDKNGTALVFKCGSSHIPYFYEGAVPLAPAA